MELSDSIRWNPYPVRCIMGSGAIPPGSSTSARTTKWYELEYFIEGSGSVTGAGNELPTLAGTLCFRPPGLAIQSRLPYRSILIVFDLIFAEERLPLYQETGFLEGGPPPPETACPPETIHVKPAEPLRDWFEEFSDHYLSASAGRWLKMKQLLLNVLEYLARQQPDGDRMPRSVARHGDEISALQNYIRTHIAEPFSLKKAAEFCGLSEGFLCRLFRRSSGISLVDYVNEAKVSYAKRLLSETNLPIRAVAASSGFQTETYFYTLFKRIEGVTPTHFREMHRLP